MSTLTRMTNFPLAHFSYWKNIFLIGVFFIATPLTLMASMLSLYVLSNPIENKVLSQTSVVSGVQIFNPQKVNAASYDVAVGKADSKVELVRQYLHYYGSSLEPYAQTLVDVANYFDIDFRLMPAIAQQESNLCKKIPSNTYNCWGWGIHSEGTLGFGSYEEAIWSVGRGLKEEYLDEGLTTPEEIMSKYTPLSNGSWAEGVNEFMNELE